MRPSGSSAGPTRSERASYTRSTRGAAYVGGLDVTPGRICLPWPTSPGRSSAARAADPAARSGEGTVQRVAAGGRRGLRRCRARAARSWHRVVIGTPGAFDPSTRRLRYARHLPGWHDPDLLVQLWPTLGLPLEVDNDVNLAAVAELQRRRARGDRRLRPALGRRGTRCGDRHRRPAAPRRHRGCRRGRLPAAAGYAARAQRRPQQRRRVPGARRRQGGARAGPRQPACGPARRGGAVAKALGTPGAGDRPFWSSWRTGSPLGLAAVVSVLDPELVVLAGGVLRLGASGCSTSSRSRAARLWRCRAPASSSPASPDDPC